MEISNIKLDMDVRNIPVSRSVLFAGTVSTIFGLSNFLLRRLLVLLNLGLKSNGNLSDDSPYFPV